MLPVHWGQQQKYWDPLWEKIHCYKPEISKWHTAAMGYKTSNKCLRKIDRHSYRCKCTQRIFRYKNILINKRSGKKSGVSWKAPHNHEVWCDVWSDCKRSHIKETPKAVWSWLTYGAHTHTFVWVCVFVFINTSMNAYIHVYKQIYICIYLCMNESKNTNYKNGLFNIPTMFEQNFREGEKSQWHKKVWGPVNCSGDAGAGWAGPTRVNFTIDGPWHWSHTCYI